jgi:hypothetical protein
MPSAEDRAEAKRIAGEIAKIGFVLPGSVTKRYLTCTHQGCRCHGEPPRLHGPYWYWTRKVNGKTVTKSLREEQVEDYKAWFDNEKRLRDLVRELEMLSLDVFNADPRWPKPRRKGGAGAVDDARSETS